MSLLLPSFSSISKESRWAVNWSIVAICTSIILLILQSYESFQFLFTNMIDNVILDLEGYLGLLFSVLGFIATIVILIWFYRANKNIHAFGAKEVSSPRMAVIWWFIPILFLWKPYRVASEIYHASDPQIVLSSGNEWKNSSSDIIKLWWVLGLLSLFAYYYATFYWNWNGGEDYYLYSGQPVDLTSVYRIAFYANFAYISSNILFIISTIYFIRIIKQVSAWQEIKAGRSI